MTFSEFSGKTISGDGRGKTLGFPTLNITVSETTHEKINDTGVFIVKTEIFIEEKIYTFFGLLHLGSRPTFNEPEFRIEIFILKNGEINKNIDILNFLPQNITINVFLVKKIRNIIEFPSAEKLVEQIKKDVSFSEKFLFTL